MYFTVCIHTPPPSSCEFATSSPSAEVRHLLPLSLWWLCVPSSPAVDPRLGGGERGGGGGGDQWGDESGVDHVVAIWSLLLYDVALMIVTSGINVDPLSFAWRNGDGCQRYCLFHSRCCFCKRFPSSFMLFVLPWFLSFRFRTFQFHSQFEPKRRSCLETEMGPEFQYCKDLHDDKRERSRLGQFSYSYDSSLLLKISDRYEATYILGINVPFRSVLLYQV